MSSSAASVQVSIVIDNYNYARFLPCAIESALVQRHRQTEVIVVDDGSTDGSRDVIARYAQRVTPVLKENGGQASAFNAGLPVSRGDVIIFLDADDVLLPTAAERVAEIFQEDSPVKVHWPLMLMDAQGKSRGRCFPARPLPEGDLRDAVMRHGPSDLLSPPTSGNAWSRRFLERVLPMPEAYTLCADDYLYALAPAFGRLRRIVEPQGYYRLHGANNYLGKSFEEKLALGLDVQAQQCAALERFFAQTGRQVDTRAWLERTWFQRLGRAVNTLYDAIARDETFILVDEDQWGTSSSLGGRRRIPFTERDGQYWGPPSDDAAAIDELQRLRSRGGSFIVFTWSVFWWLDHYPEFHRYLQTTCRSSQRDEEIVLFDLRT